MTGTQINFNSQDAWNEIDCGVDLNGFVLTSGEVDNALIAFSGGSFLSRQINLSGSNAARTAASNGAVSTLEGNGNTVTTS